MSRIRVRHGGALIGAAAACLLAASPAAAAPATVEVDNGSFAPADVSVAPGETVTWHWAGSGHDVKLSGAEAFTTAFNSAGATYVHRFTTPGTYSYVCEAHPAMKGQVVVAGEPPGPAAAAGPAPTPTAVPVAATAAPRVAALRPTPSGARLRVGLTAPARLQAEVARLTRSGWRTVAHVDRPAAAGRTVLRWTRAAIVRGRYRVAVVALDAAGRASPAVRRGFVVRRTIAALPPAPPRALSPPAVAPAPAIAEDSGALAPPTPEPEPQAPKPTSGRNADPAPGGQAPAPAPAPAPTGDGGHEGHG